MQEINMSEESHRAYISRREYFARYARNRYKNDKEFRENRKRQALEYQKRHPEHRNRHGKRLYYRILSGNKVGFPFLDLTKPLELLCNYELTKMDQL